MTKTTGAQPQSGPGAHHQIPQASLATPGCLMCAHAPVPPCTTCRAGALLRTIDGPDALARLEQEAATQEQLRRLRAREEAERIFRLETEPTQGHLDKLNAALVDTHGLDGIPDPEPLIGDDILFRDSLVWMVGKPGCMKSFTALDMAGCIATGEKWQGFAVTQGPVLYLVAEGVRGTKKRVRAWEQSMGHVMEGVTFLPVAVQSKVEGQWSALVELVREMKPILVILDTQARVTVGVEENSNTAMGEFVEQLERLREASGATVMVVHHIGRNGETGRGATVLDGSMSTIVKVTRDDDRVTLECHHKNKDGAEWDPIHLRAVPMGESVILMIDDGTRPAGGLSHGALKMATAWCANHGSGNTVGASSLVDVVATRTTFYRNVRELERAGMVDVDRSGRHPRYRLTRCPE